MGSKGTIDHFYWAEIMSVFEQRLKVCLHFQWEFLDIYFGSLLPGILGCNTSNFSPLENIFSSSFLTERFADLFVS